MSKTKKGTTKKTTKKESSKKTTSTSKAKKGNTVKKTTVKSNELFLMKTGLDEQGNQKYTEIKVYKRKPAGWKETNGATTAPRGYKWIDNGKSHFGGKRRSALLKTKK